MVSTGVTGVFALHASAIPALPSIQPTSRNTLLTRTTADCKPAFNTIINSVGADSASEYRAFVPSEVNWRHGDRIVVWTAFDTTSGASNNGLFQNDQGFGVNPANNS